MHLPSKNKMSPFLLEDQSTNSEISLKETADHINTSFANIGFSLVSKFTITWSFDVKVPESKMEPVILNEEDVLDAVKNIDTSKLSAIDNLSSIVLKDAFLVLV